MEKWVAAIIFIAFLAVAGHGIYDFVKSGQINGAAILSSFILLSFFFNWINGQSHDGNKGKEKEEQIALKSAKVSYFVLMVLSVAILFISEGVTNISDINNYPLLVVAGLTFVVLPITEFFYWRRQKK